EQGQEQCYADHAMPRIRLHCTEMISATNIRRHILEGNVRLAAELLGRPYALTGVVVHGAKRGRTIGYPTANLAHDSELIVPTLGIYATLVDVPGVVQGHAAMTSVGVRPVFDNGERMVEAHLLDWSGDLYDRPLTLHFLEWLRPEENFPSVGALIEQMGRDGTQTREVVQAWREGSPEG
ncbi:MAG: riboflavin kinase, partial [Thermomicrobiales bacterium]